MKRGSRRPAGIELIAGVDEAGRGPLAGPVLAAAVILAPDRPIEGLADSKKLSEKKRQALNELVKQQAVAWSIAAASVEEIDELNILQATMLAMKRAVEGLEPAPDRVLVDGNCLPDLAWPARAIVKGDSKVAAISAASILAKVARDEIMVAYHQRYPNFAMHQHKAYGSRQHLQELERYGPLPIHRKSFAPVRRLLDKRK